MNKYAKTTIISLCLSLAIFPTNGADTQSQKMFVGSFLGIAAYGGWLFCKKFTNKIQSGQNRMQHQQFGIKKQSIHPELSIYLPEVLSDLTAQYAENTFEDIHVSTPESPHAQGEIFIEKVSTSDTDALLSLFEPDEIERFSITLDPWDTLESIQAKVSVYGISPEKQLLFLNHNGNTKKIEKFEDLSTILTNRNIQVYRKE